MKNDVDPEMLKHLGLLMNMDVLENSEEWEMLDEMSGPVDSDDLETIEEGES